MSLPALVSLPEIRAALWSELARATHDKHHEWRTCVLATVSQGGADARNVVLREVDSDAQALRFFSDARAAKLAQIEMHPEGTVVVWSRRLSWQLRLRVALSAQVDGLAVASRWARLKSSPAAQDYLAPLAPGLALPTTPASAKSEPPTESATELTTELTTDLTSGTKVTEQRAYFALLTANVLSMDWLELRTTGHRRAVFDSTGARWITP
jgi:pyridoxamine 5'-phosphate oxidase